MGRIFPMGAGLAAGLAALAITTVAASAQQRLPRECRQEIRQMCSGERAAMRACVREKFQELSADCREELRNRLQDRRNARATGPTRLPPQKFDLVTYGEHERQAIDFYRAQGAPAADAPALILFIHGGGWKIGDRTRTVQAKPAHFTAAGYAFASTGYRLLPEAPVETQARDVASAIAQLRSQAATLGFDPNRIVLMGHSAGAHLAALMATDPQYAGDDMAAIRGVVLLDGAGYDIAENIRTAGARSKALYGEVFGDNPDRQAALSPITHVGGPDAPNWLVLYVADRARSKAQSESLASALGQAGAYAEAVPISGTDHGRMNREIGTPAGAAQTQAIDDFLAKIAG